MSRPCLRLLLMLSILICTGLDSPSAHAFPAFARRYNVDCTTCHTNPPRLNNFGIAFMRRGFKMNWDEKLEGQKVQEYLSFQTTVDAVSVNPGTPQSTLTDTQMSALTAGPISRQLSYYAEVDYDPLATFTSVHEARAILLFPTKPSEEGKDKNKDTWYSVSIGAIRPFSTWQKGLTETQTIDSPMIFAQVPVGGFSFVPDNPQYGVEVAYNSANLSNYGHGTYAALAVLSGLNVNAQTPDGPIGLTQMQNGTPDIEAQLSHYFGPRNSISLMYYSGSIRFNPGNVPFDVSTFPFLDSAITVNSHYDRFFLNGNWSPDKQWDFLAGGMVGNDTSNPLDGTSTPSSGAYVEANYYFNPKYVAALRYDTFNLNSNASGNTTSDLVLAVKGQLQKNVFVTLEYNDTTNTDSTHTDTATGELRLIW